MAIPERTYTVPLRREWLKVPRYRRAKKAAIALREFLQRHMKSEDVKLGKELNLELWKHGMRNPPHHVKLTALKDEKGIVRANLYGKPIELPKKEEPKKAEAKKEEKPAEKKAEAAKADAKPAEPKKEAPKHEAPKAEHKPAEKKA
jgi:large subunit ribosomal protein L31e